MAVALYDAHAVSQGRAAQIVDYPAPHFWICSANTRSTPFQYEGLDDLWGDLETLAERDAASTEVVQGSPEWNARLHSTFRAAISLTDEQTRRESLYGDNLR